MTAAPHRVLLIGLGKIGYEYDRDSEAVSTWAKALSRRGDIFDTVVHDIDPGRRAEVAQRYGFGVLADLGAPEALAGIGTAIVASPTATHFDTLSQLLDAKVPWVLCEKPLCASTAEQEALTRAAAESPSKIFVNFHRNALPAFRTLAVEMQGLDALRVTVSVRVQNGILNNGSHAVALLEMLFPDRTRRYRHAGVVVDRPGPTGRTADIELTDLGTTAFSFWEIDIFWSEGMVRLTQGGNRIERFDAGAPLPSGYRALEPRPPVTGTLDDYMEVALAAHIDRIGRGDTGSGVPFDMAVEVNDICTRLAGAAPGR